MSGIQLTKLALILLFALPSSAFAAVFYVDFSDNTAPWDGTTPATAYNSLDSFTEVARSAGDIAFVRRGTASTTNVSDLNFTSDGTIANPIKISADYDNIWGDFATSSQTYTVAIATSTFTGSATIAGIAAGDWVYVAGDCFENPTPTALNQCEFAYEVESIQGHILRLYVPYKGNQSGSGLALRVMPDNPQWNVASGDFQWNFDTDDYWLVKGMDIRGTDVNGQVEIDSSQGISLIDTIFTGNGITDMGVDFTDDKFLVSITKSRFFGSIWGIGSSLGDVYGNLYFESSLIDCNSVASSFAFQFASTLTNKSEVISNDSFIRNCANGISEIGGGSRTSHKNLLNAATTEITTQTTGPDSFYYLQDWDGVLGDTRQNNYGSGTNLNANLLLSTTTLRSGGGPNAIEVRPTTNTTSIWDFNKIKLFEYPIYTNTTSRQYDVYFRNATSTSDFGTDPTANELWIQCEYWAHDTGATSTRKVKKSTGLIDFNGNNDWQNLSVTCQPSQSGIMYLSGYYAKTKESTRLNYFIVDSRPVIQ